jgi:hypothetical protein
MADDQILHRDTAREEYFYQLGRFEAMAVAAEAIAAIDGAGPFATVRAQAAVVRNAKEQIA